MSYSPPLPLPSPELEKKGRRSRIVAVILGLAVELIGLMIFILILTIVRYVIFRTSGGSAGGKIVPLNSFLTGQLILLSIGLCFTILGAYVAARFANYSEYRVVLAVGILSILIGEGISFAFRLHQLPLWHRLLCDLLTIPAVLFGGYLGATQKRRIL